MEDNYCLIMAGGIGSRFWPVSTQTHPKQFHDILGTGETLIQHTFKRLCKISKPDKILVVTHKKYVPLVKEQLPELPEENIIREPARRNTAPCIAYAAYHIIKRNPRANMLVAPSDHLITDESEFTRISELALETAATGQYLLTLGIRPHRPDTGYGYIQFSDEAKTFNQEVKKVKTFTEKPDEDMAQQFLDSGDFLWNSGIFIWSVASFREELKKYLPDLHTIFEEGLAKLNTPEETAFAEEVYPSCENESIDYGLMEKSENVYVIPADFGWSDLGTWGSLYEHTHLDEDQNALLSNKVITYSSRQNIVRVPKNKTAVLEGLEGYIVIDEDDALLICRMENEQLIKSFVNDVKLRFGENEE